MPILEPVRRGLVGYYDARSYWQRSDTPIEEIADLSGNLHNLKEFAPNFMSPPVELDRWKEVNYFPMVVKNKVFGDWPAFTGNTRATYSQGVFVSEIFSTRLFSDVAATICILCRINAIHGKVGLNSTTPVTIGYFGVDSYWGPLAGGFVDTPPQWTSAYLAHPWGKLVDWDNAAPGPATRIVLGADIDASYFRQDGVVQEEIITGTPVFAPKNIIAINSGNPWTDVGIALVYNVKLTPEECEQNEQFMDWTTSESLPYMFQQPRGGELP